MKIGERLKRIEQKKPRKLDAAAIPLIESAIAAYHTPEAAAEREAFYNEVQRIGALRREAHQRGESMDAYPLPWGTDNEDYRAIETA